MSFVFASKDGSGDITDNNGKTREFPSAEKAAEWAQANGVSPEMFDIEEITVATPKSEAKKETESSVLRTASETIFPRTMQAAEEGEEFPVLAGIMDVASIPGRATMGALSAAQQGLHGTNVPDSFLASMARPHSTSEWMPARFLSEIVRDPLTLLIPGAGAIAGRIAQGAGKLATIAGIGGETAEKAGTIGREVLRVGSEAGTAGAAGGQEQGTFSIPSAAVAGIPGAAAGAKFYLDRPVWGEVMSPSRVAANLYKNEFKPVSTLSGAKGNQDLLNTGIFEERFFKPSEYGPAPMQDAKNWFDVQDRVASNIEGIGEKNAASIASESFDTPVPFLDVMETPVRARQRVADNTAQTTMDEIIDWTEKPFYDLYSSLAARTAKGTKGDREAAAQALKIVEEGGPAFVGSIPLRDVLEARRMLTGRAKYKGKYQRSSADANAEVEAYSLVMEELNNLIKAYAPNTEDAAMFMKTQKDFAQWLPWNSALSQGMKARMLKLMDEDQKAVTRLVNMNASKLHKTKVGQAVLKDMPEVVRVNNAWRLYNAAGPEYEQAARMLQQGGAGYSATPFMQQASPFFRSLMKVQQDEEQK